MQSNRNERIWELDFFRGIAIVLMIYFHIVYDMKEVFGYKVEYSSGINFYLGKASAILFIIIAGISCSLSRNNLRRGLKVLAVALIITLVSWLYNPKFLILFGILHFLAICMLLSPYLMKINKYSLMAIGTLLLILRIWINKVAVDFDYFFLVGITSKEFISSDYYPLIPWMGIFIYGIFLGKFLYRNMKSIFGFALKDNVISFVGRHTLIVYLIHQPIILGVLALINLIF